MHVRWEEANSVKYLVADYQGIAKSDEMVKILREYTDIIKSHPGKINCLEIYEGSFGSKDFIEEGKKLGKEVHVHKIDKNVFIGVTRIKKILLKAYVKVAGQSNVKTFSTKEETVKWLTH